eukprot:6184616-Pleurochrysis_carterae.AAC.1
MSGEGIAGKGREGEGQFAGVEWDARPWKKARSQADTITRRASRGTDDKSDARSCHHALL